MSPLAVLFDFDGTLLDTESIALLTWRAAYAYHGLELDEPAWLDTVGTDGDRYAALAHAAGPDFDIDGCQRRRRSHEARLVRVLEPRDGISDVLDALAGDSVRLAVVSSSPADWVRGHLTRLGLDGRFDVIVTREDAPRAKPHPDLYAAALATLGVGAPDAVAVEDSLNGVRAARAAGLRCIALPNAVTARQDLTCADAICSPGELLSVIATLTD
jgi:HAD superfamily hydrolase (TIGR01509 family)